MRKAKSLGRECFWTSCLCDHQQEWWHCPSQIGEFWWMNVPTSIFLISSTGKIRLQRQLASFSRPGKIRVSCESSFGWIKEQGLEAGSSD